LRWRRVFPGEECQLAALRRWVAGLLPACPSRDDVALVATELASNAIKHTRSGQGHGFAAEINWYPATVRIAVADGGGPSEPRLVDDPFAEHGRGLVVVRGLSQRTGYTGSPAGRTAWADIAWLGPDCHHPTPGHEPVALAAASGQADSARTFTGIPWTPADAMPQWWTRRSSGQLVTAPAMSQLAMLLGQLLRHLSRPGEAVTTGHGRRLRGPGRTQAMTDSRPSAIPSATPNRIACSGRFCELRDQMSRTRAPRPPGRLTKLAQPGTKPPRSSWLCLMRAVTCAPQVKPAGGGLAFRAGLLRRQPAPPPFHEARTRSAQ